MFVSYILSKVRSYMRYRETVRELSLLSDRELDDLGISRFQIENVARRARFRIKIRCIAAKGPRPPLTGGRSLVRRVVVRNLSGHPRPGYWRR